MGLLQDIFGKKPTVPAWTPIDYGQVQQAATQQNLDVLPLANQLASQTNALNQAELDRLLNQQIPDLSQIKKNISGKLASETAGQLSPDVQAAVERSAVARSLGSAGGSMGGAWVARDIGRTSYDISNMALSSAERWLNTTRSLLMPGLMGAQAMFVTPQQRLAQQTEERNLRFERDWLKNQVEAMPDPASHAVWQVIHEIGMKALGFAMGGMGGGSSNPNTGAYTPPPQWGGYQNTGYNSNWGGQGPSGSATVGTWD